MQPSPPATPRFTVVVVSYQVRELLRRCLETIRAQRGADLECWVVDNASTDGSADMVASAFPSVNLVRGAENLGFARANNLALERATGDWLALVNPDTELPPEALATVAGVFGRWPGAGCVGLALTNADGSHQPACHAFPTIPNLAAEAVGLHGMLRRFGVGTPQEAPIPRAGEGLVDWVSGAFMVLSREAYARVGGLRPQLFMYGEEMDWSWRARHAGLQTVFSTRARVLHHGGASSEGQLGPLFVKNLESRLAFVRRYRGRAQAAVARELLLAGSRARRVYWELRGFTEGDSLRPYTRAQLERFRAASRWRPDVT